MLHHAQLLESQLDEWMDVFHTLATFKHEQLAAADAAGDSEKQGALDAVKAAGTRLHSNRGRFISPHHVHVVYRTTGGAHIACMCFYQMRACLCA